MRSVFCLSILFFSVWPLCAAPTHKVVPYATEHPAQRLDVYVAKSDEAKPVMIFYHGGGWRAGSKSRVPGFLRRAVEQGWLSVVAVEYRFTNVATHPAQVNDCLRAIQFIRHKAKKWNIDAERMGATGGSAGGHLSMYVALHDDIANPNAADPVAQLSSRVSCAVPFAGPTDWSLLKTIEHKHPAYRQLIGHTPGTPVDEMDAKRMTNVSPISHVSADDPPVMVVHGDSDAIVPYIHATEMVEALKAVQVETELVTLKGGGHNVAGAGHREAVERAIPFIRKHLKVK